KQRLVPPISVPTLKARSPAHDGGRLRMKTPPRARPRPHWVSSATQRVGTLLAPDLFRQRIAALGLSSRPARLSGSTHSGRSCARGARDLFGGLIYSNPEGAEEKNASGDGCWGNRHSHSRDRGVGVCSRCRKCD